MNAKRVIGSALLLTAGLILVAYYDLSFKPENEAGKLYREAKLIQERNDRESINRAIDIYTKVIARYPDTRAAVDSTFMVAESYEKVDLYKLAYLKYSYLLKNPLIMIDQKKRREVIARLAALKIKRNYSDEGLAQLYSVLKDSVDTEFRSRIYSEIGYTHLRLGSVQKADNAFNLALRENHENEEALLGKARALRRLGKNSEAFAKYDYFLSHHGAFSSYTPDVKRAYLNQVYNSALSNFRNGSYWQAIKFFNIVLSKFPGSKYTENSLYWIGESYSSLGRYESAVRYYNKTLSNGYYHKDEDARIKKGYAYFSQKKYDLATREFQIYLEKHPKGRYSHIATRWKETSSRELIQKLRKSSIEEEVEFKEPETKARHEVSPPAKTTESEKDVYLGSVARTVVLDDVTEL
ncbi:MAG: tetratricopeptide repeat protein [Spirochaetes bacterium]|jgi:TolA-binding protein|nr:tetratricopeptide repeat protein [Spirochaetota bacterium]